MYIHEHVYACAQRHTQKDVLHALYKQPIISGEKKKQLTFREKTISSISQDNERHLSTSILVLRLSVRMIKSKNTLNSVIKSYSVTSGMNISMVLFIVLFTAYSA